MTRAATVALLHGGSHAQLATLADPALEPYRIRPVHVRTGDLDDIRDVDVLVVADRLRPDLLTRWTDTITDCLGRGATVVVFGENNSGDWLPASARSVAPPSSGGGAPARITDCGCGPRTIRRGTTSPNSP